MSRQYDAVIVGGGHNGLVCGAYLARAGVKVCVLERRSMTGGAAVTEEVWPGYRVSTASYVMGLMQPKVILDLELQKYGFEVIPAAPITFRWPTAAISPCGAIRRNSRPKSRASRTGMRPPIQPFARIC